MFSFPQLLLLWAAFFILVVGLPMVFVPKKFGAIMEKSLKNLDAVRIRGFLTMIVGFLFLSVYQKFNQGWAMTFSIFGYLSLIKGLVLLRFPGYGYTKFKWFYASRMGSLITGLIVLLFALFLIWIALMKI